MSRIGKLPIAILEGVSVSLTKKMITVTGPKGELTYTFVSGVTVVQEDNTIVVSVDKAENNKFWGLTRTLIDNMIIGVTSGYEKKLLVLGVGYNAKVSGSNLTLNLGYSHPIDHVLPSGISAVVEQDPKGNTVVAVSGIDKQLVGQEAAKIRSYRKPEPYKGKGVRYVGEYIEMKAGKTATK